jgi:hypothetical protein
MLSLQTTLYNESVPDNGSCCIGFLADNYSINEIDYEIQLRLFFELLGLNLGQIKIAFAIARESLPQDYGILLQFFDYSHLHSTQPPYHLLDRCAYPSVEGGQPINFSKLPSNYLLEGEEFPQLRLVISNRYTLNPHSYFAMTRYDGIDKNILHNYGENLRSFYRSQVVDPLQRENYKQLLLAQWSP